MSDGGHPLIDPERHRVIDLSYTVPIGEDVGREFAVSRSNLADNSYRYDVHKTHSHVGTHVEGGAHFYGGNPDDDPDVETVEDRGDRDHRAIVDYPLDTFYGPGVLFSATEPGPITESEIEAALDGHIQKGDIVVARNDTPERQSKAQQYEDGGPPAPTFTEESARWLADWGVECLVLGGVGLGDSRETSNVVHDVLMSRGCVFVEFVRNTQEISRDRFTVMSLPWKVERLGSSFCRTVVIEER